MDTTITDVLNDSCIETYDLIYFSNNTFGVLANF